MQNHKCAVYRAVTLMLILLLASPPGLSTVRAEDAIYKYKDSSGTVHYVDDPAKIPEEYSSPEMQPHNLPEIQREGALVLGEKAAPKNVKRRSLADDFKEDLKSDWNSSNRSVKVTHQRSSRTSSIAGAFGLGIAIAMGLYMVVLIASYWILFQRVGLPGWGILIPIYSFVLISRLAGKSGWWTLLLLIPFIGAMFWSASTSFMMAKRFGRSDFFALGNIFFPPIFVPIMAFFPVR